MSDAGTSAATLPADGRPTILVLAEKFRRGFEAAGPNQAIAEMGRCLSGQFRFRVLTYASEGDVPDRWSEFLGLEQLPLARGRFGPKGLLPAIRSIPHDLLLLTSFFDPHFTIATLVKRRLGQLSDTPVLLASHGEFSSGALSLKSTKKLAYLNAAKAFGLTNGVAFQATNEAEMKWTRQLLKPDGPILLGPNVRKLPPLPAFVPPGPGEPLRIAFLSRVDRMKNLDIVLDVLAGAGVPAALSIYGPVSDETYWAECRERMATLPSLVRVHYYGEVPNPDVLETLARQDLFFLPSQGENFSYAIVDALLAGTPVLISDRTPWRGLEAAGAGWDVPLEDVEAFAAAIRIMAAAKPARRLAMRESARRYIEDALRMDQAVEKLEQCLRSAMTTAESPGGEGRSDRPMKNGEVASRR